MATQVFTPSAQQSVVLNWVDTGRGNAFVEAVAGAGKTTTLIEACRRMKGSVAFAAYNKKIATEIQAKLSGLGLGNQVRAGTFHSFGFGAWRRVHPKVRVDDKAKRDAMLLNGGAIRGEDGTVHQLSERSDLHSAVVKLVSLAKQSACGLFWQPGDDSKWYEIAEHHDIPSDLEEPADIDLVIPFAKRGLEWSRKVAGDLIDFDDMIYMPVVSNCKIWQNDWLLVDEAQDTNPARRALARRMVGPRGRVIFVGDRHQAIYGFTGADSDAVDQIIRDFNCVSLPLTTTYRCPQRVVREAQRYVSHIVAHETAPEGSVSTVKDAETFWKQTVPSLSQQDAILCRKTKPLVDLAFGLIRKNIGCHVEGRDIGQGLIALATRWKSAKTTRKLAEYLEAYKEKQVAKLMAKGQETAAESVADKVDTLFVVMAGCDTVDCVVAKIRDLFKDTEDGKSQTLTLSTVHKSKGREWNRVLVLGWSDYMPSPYARQSWQLDQERNLQYVCVTRSQNELIYLPKLEA